MKLSNPKNNSRTSALRMLEEQLKRGTKPLKNEKGKTTNQTIELSETDKNRIKREIETLKNRIVID